MIKLSIYLSNFACLKCIFNQIFLKKKLLKNDPNKIEPFPLQHFVDQEQRANSPESSDKVSKKHLKKSVCHALYTCSPLFC